MAMEEEDVEMEEVDMGYEDAAPTVDMGYEEAVPSQRRGSMTHAEEKERRASITAIMKDDTMAPLEKRLSIQHLMDGRRNSLTSKVSEPDTTEYGYGSDGGGGPPPDNPYGNEYCYGDEAGGARAQYAISNEYTKRMEQSRAPCAHYERKCTIIAPCCGAAFGCRICHDDCPVLPPKINNGGRRYHRSASLPSSFTNMEAPPPEESGGYDDTHHNIDRFAIREVICRDCFTRQSAKAYVHVPNDYLVSLVSLTFQFLCLQ
jgi:hypothetical protein